jgi:hypothetical protein
MNGKKLKRRRLAHKGDQPKLNPARVPPSDDRQKRKYLLMNPLLPSMSAIPEAKT